jgi:WD40-like Beta Propeller Repeat
LRICNGRPVFTEAMRRALLLWLLLTLLFAADAHGAVLVYQRAGSNEIFASYANGSNPRLIAHGRNPTVSPNGRRAVFVRRRPLSDDLYVVSTKGGRPRLVARNVFVLEDPRSEIWAPDSRRVVVGDPGGYDAFVIDVLRRTRRVIGVDGDFGGVSFSPSGKRIALVNAHPRDSDTYVVGLDGSHERFFAPTDHPVWGRPGISFFTGRSVVVKAGPGKPPRTLLDEPAVPIAWSADGHRLLVQSTASTASLVDVPSGGKHQVASSFTALDGISRDGSLVLGESGGDVVAARVEGKPRVLASDATLASWTR